MSPVESEKNPLFELYKAACSAFLALVDERERRHGFDPLAQESMGVVISLGWLVATPREWSKEETKLLKAIAKPNKVAAIGEMACRRRAAWVIDTMREETPQNVRLCLAESARDTKFASLTDEYMVKHLSSNETTAIVAAAFSLKSGAFGDSQRKSESWAKAIQRVAKSYRKAMKHT